MRDLGTITVLNLFELIFVFPFPKLARDLLTIIRIQFRDSTIDNLSPRDCTTATKVDSSHNHKDFPVQRKAQRCTGGYEKA